MALIPLIQEVRKKFSAIITENKLGKEAVQVKIIPLSARQAIGSPKRDDFALLRGKEVVIEAQFRGSFGHAFTSHPGEFEGTINDIQNSDLDNDRNRALYICTLNAVMSHLEIVTGVRHCRDDEPEQCGDYIARDLLERFGVVKIGLIGFQPSILENLTGSFGIDNVQCSDLNPLNIGSNKFGVDIRDGMSENPRLIQWCDVLLITSSALVNDTFEDIYRKTLAEGKVFINFGVTGAGVSELLGIERICPFGH